jgi:uncharacterized protein YgbK (DUF1537 family)
MNKPNAYKTFEEFVNSQVMTHIELERLKYLPRGDLAKEFARSAWNACQASMQAQHEEEIEEITRITKNYAYCSALLKNLADRSLLSNEAMEAVNNFIKQ